MKEFGQEADCTAVVAEEETNHALGMDWEMVVWMHNGVVEEQARVLESCMRSSGRRLDERVYVDYAAHSYFDDWVIANHVARSYSDDLVAANYVPSSYYDGLESLDRSADANSDD